ncbi:MAG: hypothetical protein BZY75_02140 [SAR202 cluster bacterium Io17-Chloro-G7]|nr:MAG: hypothetical protein BZY75_02140 [SAR202 cluster bacterium Io17-Chloro-G7]
MTSVGIASFGGSGAESAGGATAQIVVYVPVVQRASEGLGMVLADILVGKNKGGADQLPIAGSVLVVTCPRKPVQV